MPLYAQTSTPLLSPVQQSKVHLNIGYVQLTDTGLLCFSIDSTRTAIELRQLLVLWLEIRHSSPIQNIFFL